MGFNINDLKYNLLTSGIGEIIKACHNNSNDKEDIERSVALSQEIGRIISEVRDSNGTPDQKKAIFAYKLTDILRKFGTPEGEIDDIVQQIISLLS